MSNTAGMLYVVATPLGNLGDMSPRAIETLQAVDLILAEDTRHSLPLLRHFGIATPCRSLHEHNERQLAERLCQRMVEGERLALISDAGTPLVSDPGYVLVKTAHQQGLAVSPLPGPSAAMAALSVAGMPSDRFVFEGFLPAKTQSRRQRLEALAEETRTLIFYESPRRLLVSLEAMQASFGPERPVTLVRELSKRYETVRKSTLQALATWVDADPQQQKGEIVLVVQGNPQTQESGTVLDPAMVLSLLLEEMPVKKAAAIASRLTGQKRNALYRQALELKERAGSVGKT